jgi:hypothetical protein
MTRSKHYSKTASIAKTGDWRRRPESAVSTYVTVIDRSPEAVEKALMNKP